ncbi:MAG: hypothetical protein JRE43_04165 [Deltaproteobacteria bacterium]|nr:hypothetical protein [Deltaproteobacteria bacterium]
MSKLVFAISLMTLMACGSGDSDSGTAGSASDSPPVSATAPTGGDAKSAGSAAMEAGSGKAEAEAAEISSCLRLVASAKYEEAVPVCLEAAKIDADNAEVKAALKKAETEAAKEAATGAAADALGGLGD